MNLSDRRKFWRYVAGAGTFAEIHSACAAVMSIPENSPIYSFTVYGILVAYCQPFTDQTGGKLEDDIVPTDNLSQQIHRNALLLRDKIIAHCDGNFEFDRSQFNVHGNDHRFAQFASVYLTANSDWELTKLGASRAAYFPKKSEIPELGVHAEKLAMRCIERALTMLKSMNADLLRRYGNKEVQLAVNVHLGGDPRLLIELREYAELLKSDITKGSSGERTAKE